ncbi:MAG: tetraacyldisaccharide 4'-kinase [Rhodomicrobium sp.]
MRLEPPSWWYQGPIPHAAWGLWPISAIYGAAVQRRFRTASAYRSKLPVLCIGNFTLGGAGKTPVALKLASLLRERGYTPAFLTRGYGGRERGPHIVDLAFDDAGRVGDEPLLLAAAAPAALSRDRPAGARLLESLAAGVIVMDDGFQNPTIGKDFSLIVIDGGAGIGSGQVFPLGPLRAPLPFQAAMAGAVLILGRQGSNAPLKQKLLSAAGRALDIFEADILPEIAEDLRGRPYLAFCGIGRPAKFFDTLRQAGIEAVQTRSFPDHHPFTPQDAQSLIAEAKALRAGLLTTEKDLVRLKGKAGPLAELYRSARALPITIQFSGDQEASLMAAILSRIKQP